MMAAVPVRKVSRLRQIESGVYAVAILEGFLEGQERRGGCVVSFS